MKPPHATDAAIGAGWRGTGVRIPRPGARLSGLSGLGRKARLAALALVVMAVSLLAVVAWERIAPEGPATVAGNGPGTAFLGTTTCADWRDATVARRLTIVQTLAVAATQPDPENAGATLGQGAAYGLFQRVCSGSATDSSLLYESYNRAASFSSLRAGSTPVSGRFGRP